MGKEILRDVLFACAGVLMVMALIGLPRQGQAPGQEWQAQFQNAHLLPCYNCTSSRLRVQGPGSGGQFSLAP